MTKQRTAISRTSEASNGRIARNRRVLLLAFEGVTLVDVVGPADVFDLASRYVLGSAFEGYDVVLASVEGGDVVASNGITVKTERLDNINGPFDTVIVPGGGPPTEPPVPDGIVSWLRRHAREADRICAVCTGTFLLGEAGLIEDRRVTTHWESAKTLQSRYPETAVDAAPVYIRDGTIWTSAGFSAGSDMALALIEHDFGHHVAMEVARRLVVFIKRTGDLPQISTPLVVQASADDTFSRLHAWIMANLSADLSVSALADFVGMSPRTFARTYSERLGRTPAKTVETLRLDSAFRLLVTTNLPLKRIAAETGYGDEQNLRRTFAKNYDQTPVDIRRLHRETTECATLSGTI